MSSLNRSIQRGDIYFANLSPVIGSEQGGTRPVLILQNNTGNRCSSTVIVAAITGHIKDNHLPTHVILNPTTCGLTYRSTVLLEQIRTLDKSRLSTYIGKVSVEKMKEIDAALSISIGSDITFNTMCK